MDTTAVTTQDDLIDALIRISPAARLSYDSRGYLLNVEEDELTADAMVGSLLQRLLEDLESVGIHLTVGISELCTSWDEIGHFVNLAGVLLSTDLLPKLRNDATFAGAVKNLLEAGGGLNEPLIAAYLGLVACWPNKGPIYGRLPSRLRDNVMADERFSRHLSMLYDDAMRVSFTEVDIDKIAAYLTHVGEHRQRFFAMVAALVPHLGDERAQRLELTFQAYVQTVTAPSVLQRYAWMLDVELHSAGNRSQSESVLYAKCRREVDTCTRLTRAWPAYATTMAKTDDVLGMLLFELAARSGPVTRAMIDDLVQQMLDPDTAVFSQPGTLVNVQRILEDLIPSSSEKA